MKPILEDIGFKDVQKVSVNKSNIIYVLNTSAFNNEKRRKTFSLFIEARK